MYVYVHVTALGCYACMLCMHGVHVQSERTHPSLSGAKSTDRAYASGKRMARLDQLQLITVLPIIGITFIYFSTQHLALDLPRNTQKLMKPLCKRVWCACRLHHHFYIPGDSWRDSACGAVRESHGLHHAWPLQSYLGIHLPVIEPQSYLGKFLLGLDTHWPSLIGGHASTLVCSPLLFCPHHVGHA